MASHYTIVETSWGYAGLAAHDHGIRYSLLPQADPGIVADWLRGQLPEAEYQKNLLPSVGRNIKAYFKGDLTPFDDNIALDLNWATAFTRSVLLACRAIVPGQTRTYGQLARAVGSPQSARAVGGVMARNPLPLLIPCHRVLGAGGHLTGFSAIGGVDLKKRLLNHEGCELNTTGCLLQETACAYS
ncbi:methylated-DNA--[protein]-cysteine S-methyltransferase [Planctomycetota bacterium]